MLRTNGWKLLSLWVVVLGGAAFVLFLVPAQSDFRGALLNSSILAAGAATISLPLGALLAILITRFDLPGRSIAAACMGVLLFLPLYVQLSGWDAAFGKLGWYSLSHGSLAMPLLAGMRGAIFVHGIAAVPWVALLVGIGLSQVDPTQEEAALLVAPPPVVLWRITLPQALPSIIAALIWTTVSTTSEMTVTNIYLINPSQWTYTERFYMRLASAEVGGATMAVLPGALALAIVVVIALSIVARLSSRRRLAMPSRPVTFSTGRGRPVLTGLLWLIVIVLLGIPAASLISKAGFVVRHEGGTRIAAWSAAVCFREVASAPVRFSREFLGTAAVAFGAATIAVIAGSLLAWQARRGGWRSWPAILFVALGLAIPGPLVGAALIQLLNHDLPPAIQLADGTSKSWLLLLYDNTPLAPIVAQAVRALPLATMLLWHSFATLGDDVLAAAALDGCTPRQVFWRVALPQRWRAILAAWIVAFAVAAGDLAWAHLVTPPGLDLLQRRVFGLVHSGVEEQVAAISLVNILVYALLATLVMWLLQRLKPSRSPLRSLPVQS